MVCRYEVVLTWSSAPTHCSDVGRDSVMMVCFVWCFCWWRVQSINQQLLLFLLFLLPGRDLKRTGLSVGKALVSHIA